MATLSLFQSLPNIVTKKIIQHIMDTSSVDMTADKAYRAREKTCHSLYRSCRLWHYVILEQFYRWAVLDFGNPEKDGLSFVGLPRKPKMRNDRIALGQAIYVTLHLPFTRDGFINNLDVDFGDLETGINRLLEIILSYIDVTRLSNYPNEHLARHQEFGLTSLTCDLVDCGPEMQQLVYGNASSLNTLSITFENRSALRDMVQKESGEAVVYPFLTFLGVSARSSQRGIVETEMDDSIEHFPMLEYLNWGCNYFFSSDIIFRGSCKTLQKMVFESIGLFGEFGKRYRVFQQGLFTRLRYVQVFGYYDEALGWGHDYAGFINILFRIAQSSANHVSILTDRFEAGAMYKAIDKYPATENGLRRFEYSQATFDILHIVNMVAKLPGLEHFKCRKVESVEEGRLIRADGFVETQYLVRSPLNRRFKSIACESVFGLPQPWSLAVIVLALVCPKFMCATVFNNPKKVAGCVNNLLKHMPLKRFKGCVDNVRLK
ncbi:hypothetical protein EV175_005048 [Coemansia sp. RSA 1933]|nr:hypothetical protein EV175_005048 [Coemansia sp. RSA 1933]